MGNWLGAQTNSAHANIKPPPKASEARPASHQESASQGTETRVRSRITRLLGILLNVLFLKWKATDRPPCAIISDNSRRRISSMKWKGLRLLSAEEQRLLKQNISMICGHGIDLVEHASFRLLVAQEEAFLKRCFLEEEILFGKRSKNPIEWFASRFAAKEAVMKSLGTGWSRGVSWHGIQIKPRTDGTLSVILSGTTLAYAERRGIGHWFISISHSAQFSIASAIALSQTQKPE